VSAAVDRHKKFIFDVGCHNATDTKDGSLVSANLSQSTPFERYILQLYLNILNLNSYKIQIHIGFKFIHDSNSYNNIHIHSNNS
jgi:hypothetical protein